MKRDKVVWLMVSHMGNLWNLCLNVIPKVSPMRPLSHKNTHTHTHTRTHIYMPIMPLEGNLETMGLVALWESIYIYIYSFSFFFFLVVFVFLSSIHWDFYQSTMHQYTNFNFQEIDFFAQVELVHCNIALFYIGIIIRIQTYLKVHKICKILLMLDIVFSLMKTSLIDGKGDV